jgi:phage terminase small subunit
MVSYDVSVSKEVAGAAGLTHDDYLDIVRRVTMEQELKVPGTRRRGLDAISAKMNLFLIHYTKTLDVAAAAAAAGYSSKTDLRQIVSHPFIAQSIHQINQILIHRFRNHSELAFVEIMDAMDAFRDEYQTLEAGHKAKPSAGKNWLQAAKVFGEVTGLINAPDKGDVTNIVINIDLDGGTSKEVKKRAEDVFQGGERFFDADFEIKEVLPKLVEPAKQNVDISQWLGVK